MSAVNHGAGFWHGNERRRGGDGRGALPQVALPYQIVGAVGVAVAVGVGAGAHAEVEFPFLQVGPGDFAVGVEVAGDG